MQIIALANQKGGVAKTTTSHVLAVGLANRGYKVLSIDCDSQCNLTTVFGVSPNECELTLLELMQGKTTINDCRISVADCLDLIPCSLALNTADTIFTGLKAFTILRNILQDVSGYDFIILDCPPNLGILTMNALISANKVIIPSTADYFALQGLEQLKPSLDEVRELNPDLSISGILLTMVDNRTTLNGIMTEDIQRTAESMGTKVFDSQIRRSVKIREAQLLQSDIFAESKNASVTDDYNNFINEFLRMED